MKQEKVSKILKAGTGVLPVLAFLAINVNFVNRESFQDDYFKKFMEVTENKGVKIVVESSGNVSGIASSLSTSVKGGKYNYNVFKQIIYSILFYLIYRETTLPSIIHIILNTISRK